MDYLQKLKEPISDVPDEDITKGLASYENNQQFHSSTKPKYFFQEITMAKGESITASRCNKHSLVLWKGLLCFSTIKLLIVQHINCNTISSNCR